MVKAYWIGIALAVGVAIGLYIGRTEPEVPPPLDSGARPVTRQSPPTTSAPASSAPESVPASSASARSASSSSPARNRAFDAPGTGEQFGGGVRFHNVENGGSAPDRVQFADPMEEEFLREQRDDSWAYMREAELESAIAPETGAGHFKQDRVECRASICVVELSAQGRQVELLKKWYDAQIEPRSISFDQPLMMRGTSFSSEADGAQARFMYVNPRRLMPQPKS